MACGLWGCRLLRDLNVPHEHATEHEMCVSRDMRVDVYMPDVPPQVGTEGQTSTRFPGGATLEPT